MLPEIALITLLALLGGLIGTLTGFGSSTIMVPVLLFFYPLPETLLIAGIVHWFNNFWKIGLFWSGLNWRLILLFGVPGIVFTWIGASLVFQADEALLTRALGFALILYTLFVCFNHTFRLPKHGAVAVVGGALSGFTAGIFGVGGAIRSAFLSAFNLPKAVYLSTAGAIGVIIDSGRVAQYLLEGTTVRSIPWWSLPIFIAASLVGALGAKELVAHISQQRFRLMVMAFLFVVAIRYAFF